MSALFLKHTLSMQNNWSHFVISVAFFLSVMALPWWVTLAIGIVLLALWRSYGVVLVGGILMDLLFAPFGSMAYTYLYTTLFLALAIAAWYLERMMLE